MEALLTSHLCSTAVRVSSLSSPSEVPRDTEPCCMWPFATSRLLQGSVCRHGAEDTSCHIHPFPSPQHNWLPLWTFLLFPPIPAASLNKLLLISHAKHVGWLFYGVLPNDYLKGLTFPHKSVINAFPECNPLHCWKELRWPENAHVYICTAPLISVKITKHSYFCIPSAAPCIFFFKMSQIR